VETHQLMLYSKIIADGSDVLLINRRDWERIWISPISKARQLLRKLNWELQETETEMLST